MFTILSGLVVREVDVQLSLSEEIPPSQTKFWAVNEPVELVYHGGGLVYDFVLGLCFRTFSMER